MKLPRNIAQSKELEKCHRPSLHFVCVLIHGVLEYYAIADADLGKGSAMNMTLLSHWVCRGRVPVRCAGVCVCVCVCVCAL